MAERLQEATQCIGNRLALGNQLRTSNQQQPQRLRIHEGISSQSSGETVSPSTWPVRKRFIRYERTSGRGVRE